MENGADSRDFGDGFREALFRSTLFGDLPFIKLLYFHKGSLDLLDLRTVYSIYPMGVAAWTGRIEVLQWFIEQENDIRRPHIVTSFTAAIQGDKVESLRCLIEGFLDNELPAIDLNNGYWNSTQITDGLQLKSYRSVQYLLEKAPVMARPQDYGEVIWMTVMGGHIEVLETFICYGFPMDKPLWTPNDLVWTPIMYAHASAEPGARQIEQRLYQLGIEPVDMTKAQYRDNFERQRNQPVPTYTCSMPLSLEMEETYKQEPAKNVVYIDGPRQANRGHDARQ
ncbi:hypothetical protein KJ359_000615 [Pestalotiopsis sp. 9143b]|nr:hypothetical protein KJ359_000615 [Pestalotiopsis sp. 9143b]